MLPPTPGLRARLAATLAVVVVVLAACGDGRAPSSVADAPTFGTSADDLPATTVALTAADGTTRVVHVRVAAVPEHRQQGLMHVREVPPGTGMLFDFGGEEREAGFWMRDTPVPLDIAYVRQGVVVAIRQMAPCVDYDDASEDCPSYPPDAVYDQALEVAQGWFADHGIDVGSRLEVGAPAS
jgi:uncharacterized membrane protein (UPF0127 family)